MAHAAAVAVFGDIPFEEAAALFAGGAGWDEIREELGLEQGPPPWARGRGSATDEGDQAGDLEDVENERPTGRPAWAGASGGPEKGAKPGAQGLSRSQGRGRR